MTTDNHSGNMVGSGQGSRFHLAGQSKQLALEKCEPLSYEAVLSHGAYSTCKELVTNQLEALK